MLSFHQFEVPSCLARRLVLDHSSNAQSMQHHPGKCFFFLKNSENYIPCKRFIHLRSLSCVHLFFLFLFAHGAVGQEEMEQLELGRYMEDKHVKEFIDDLMQIVLEQQPHEPREYMIDYIKHKYLSHSHTQQHDDDDLIRSVGVGLVTQQRQLNTQHSVQAEESPEEDDSESPVRS
jgi:hypothetical protein